jgi:hypothetical protein
LLGAAVVKFEGVITKPMVESAGKIIGLDFTDAERDSMLRGLNDRLKSYE